MTKTIVLLAAGTRGDVQPYVALGIGLHAVGYAVRIAAPQRYASLVSARGLAFAPLRGNPSDLLARPGGQAALSVQPNPLSSLRASLNFVRAARPQYASMLASAWQACAGADALVCGLASLWGLHLAEALHVPCLWAFLQPFTRTRAFPSALLPVMGAGRPALNRLSYRLVEQAVWLPWRGVVNRWRRARGLPALGLNSPYAQISRADAPVLYGFSPRVAPPAPDWPPGQRITGSWLLDAPPDWQPSTDLSRFLDAGAPPLFIGFGSPGNADPARTAALIVQALRETGLRALVDLPASALPPGLDARHICAAGDVPHDWLFARLAGVAHHGGAGTTAYGLRAGAPTLVTPLAVDQFFWARRVYELGVGPKPLPQRAITAARLSERLDALAGDPALRQHARALGAALRAEDGVAEAVMLIRQALAG